MSLPKGRSTGRGSGLPPEALGLRDTLVALAIVRIYAEEGRCTFRDVAADVDCSLSTVHLAVDRLVDEGLVAFERGTAGTLRPAARVVAIFP